MTGEGVVKSGHPRVRRVLVMRLMIVLVTGTAMHAERKLLELHGFIARCYMALPHNHEHTVMTNDTRPNDAEMRARALSRWENEGGSLTPTSAAGSIDESELRILARLGAALLDEWGELSPTLRASIVQRARTLGSPDDHRRVKQMLARFLHEHRSEY